MFLSKKKVDNQFSIDQNSFYRARRPTQLEQDDMKSAAKVTVQVEDYKGNMVAVTGFKSLKLNIHGNWVGYVGRDRLENFSCAWDAADWFLGADCSGDDIKVFMAKHNMH